MKIPASVSGLLVISEYSEVFFNNPIASCQTAYKKVVMPIRCTSILQKSSHLRSLNATAGLFCLKQKQIIKMKISASVSGLLVISEYSEVFFNNPIASCQTAYKKVVMPIMCKTSYLLKGTKQGDLQVNGHRC